MARQDDQVKNSWTAADYIATYDYIRHAKLEEIKKHGGIMHPHKALQEVYVRLIREFYHLAKVFYYEFGSEAFDEMMAEKESCPNLQDQRNLDAIGQS